MNEYSKMIFSKWSEEQDCAYIKFAPGEETYEENRAWQGCPTIARTKGGRLFAGWYTGGLLEPCIDNYNVLIYSDDNGEKWSHPILAIYSDTEKMHRNIDIQLWVDEYNRLWVMWTHSPYYETSVKATIRTPFNFDYHREFLSVEAMVCKNPDADTLIWESPREICGGFIRCKPIIRENGDYIFPAYDWQNLDNYMLRFSSDKGESFYDVVAAKKPGQQAYDETMVYEIDSRLYMLARTNLGYYLSSYSDDDGKTWSEGREYQKAPSTRFYISKLSTGQLIFVRSVSDTAREGMKVCLSEDNGRSWPYELILDTRENLSYPDLAEGEDGQLYIIYDRERDNRRNLNRETWISQAAKEILLSKITLQDIYKGEISGDSYTAKVISKGLIDKVEK